MIEDLYRIEGQAYQNSPVHGLDARVKIILMLVVVVTTVAFPYTRDAIVLGMLFFAMFAALWLVSGLSFLTYFRRLALVLPFGIFIIIFQVFFENPYYEVFHPLITFPLGIHIYAESVEFASILLVKFLLCVSFVILLSSTTKMQDMLEGAGRLGFPAEFSLIIGMMIRYIFVFADMYRKIKNSLETRCFDPLNRALPYRYRFQKIGYTIGTMFLRSYEQGERTYISMLCRGYGLDSHLYITKKPLKRGEWIFLVLSVLFVITAPIYLYLA